MTDELQPTTSQPGDSNVGNTSPYTLSVVGLDVRDFYAVADAIRALNEEFIARVCKDDASIKAFNYAREIQPTIDKWPPEQRTPEYIREYEQLNAQMRVKMGGSSAECVTQALTLGHTELRQALDRKLRYAREEAGRFHSVQDDLRFVTEGIMQQLAGTHERVMACVPHLDTRLMKDYIAKLQKIVAVAEAQSKKLEPLKAEEERKSGWTGYTAQYWYEAFRPLVSLPMVPRFGPDGERAEWTTYMKNRYRSGRE